MAALRGSSLLFPLSQGEGGRGAGGPHALLLELQRPMWGLWGCSQALPPLISANELSIPGVGKGQGTIQAQSTRTTSPPLPFPQLPTLAGAGTTELLSAPQVWLQRL